MNYLSIIAVCGVLFTWAQSSPSKTTPLIVAPGSSTRKNQTCRPCLLVFLNSGNTGSAMTDTLLVYS